ncbi:MAG: glycosyltransferase [Bacteroidales bacterium]|nr:glycosyltransferase [Bacteroidales bacterium]
MRILSISSILPIPDIVGSNDFVFQTYLNYGKLYKDDLIVIIRPLKLGFNIFSIIKKRTQIQRLNKCLTKTIYGFQVEIFPFYSTWRFRNIHSLITRTLYYFNKKRISRLFATHNFDIVHAQFIFPDALLANILHHKYNVPYAVTTHNERFYFEHTISKKIALKLLNQAWGLFPINHYNFTFYKQLGLKNIELIPLGFDVSFVKNQKPLKKGMIRILTVCELIKLKNVDKVLQAVSQLVKNYDIHYTIIGNGPQKELLKQLVVSLEITEYVTFTDRIPYAEIAEEMYHHDIFIMPSYFETFGRVYFEAMAMGIPIICAKNSGIFGIFKENQEGISVDHNNVFDMVKSLEFLINNPEERHRIGLNGKKLVEQYTWVNIAEKLHLKYYKMSHS